MKVYVAILVLLSAAFPVTAAFCLLRIAHSTGTYNEPWFVPCVYVMTITSIILQACIARGAYLSGKKAPK